MDSIRISITGDHEVGLRFDEFPDDLYDALRQEIEALSAELLAAVEAATPSRTGKLRSAERLRIFTDPDSIKGYVDVSADFAKAGALEYGAHRSTKVSAHQMKLDHYWELQLSAPEMVLVAAYSRTPNIDEYAYERGPLDEMSGEIIGRLQAVVDKSVAQANG